MKLSIIIPAYNCGKFIEECIYSCNNQGLDKNEYEIIVVNDGSTDNTSEILEQQTSHIKNLIITNQRNSGVSVARNKGLITAGGQYVIFVDGDDVLREGSLGYLCGLAAKHNLDILKGNIVKSETPKNMIFKNASYKFSEIVINGEQAICDIFDPMQGYIVQNIYKREFLIQNNLFFQQGITFLEDVLMTVKTYCKAQRVMSIPYDFYIYRQNPQSCMATMNTQKLNSAIKVVKMLLEEADKTNGRVMRKIEETIFSAISVILWYLSHYKKIYLERKTIIQQLRTIIQDKSFNLNLKQMTVITLFKTVPDLYITVRYKLAQRKYE